MKEELMQKSAKILVGLAAAGLIAAGGSAFTASQTIASGSKVGYGDTTVTGINVSDVQYVVSSTDGSKLDKIKFVTSDSAATTSTGTLTVRDSSNALVVSGLSCGNAVSDGEATPKYTFTCDPTTDPAALDVVKVGLTVTKSAV